MDSKVNFFTEEISFTISSEDTIQQWLQAVSEQEGFQLEEINYIFCSDDYLLQINRQYLEHDYYTDIITFDNSDSEGLLEADIFVSIDRVRDNAQSIQQPFERELHRVLIHGVLHLMGFNDHSEEEKALMRQKEEACLSLLRN